MDLDPSDVHTILSWVKKHSFQRIALQSPDELLAATPKLVLHLCKELPGRKVFVLGDSPYGGSSVDEVGAEHYGADCIVKIGPSDQQRVCSLPVLFIFGRSPLSPTSATTLLSTLSPQNLVVVCDVALQRSSSSLVEELQSASSGDVFIADPEGEASHCAVHKWYDWRFGTVPRGAWRASLGTLLLASVAVPEDAKVCGRTLRHVREKIPTRLLPRPCTFLHVGTAESPLEKRLLLRHGHGNAVWRLDPKGAAPVRLSSEALLLRRYRLVEAARSAEVFGLLLCSTGATQSRALADRLELLLQKSGRRVYRFLLGRPAPEKLGNFPEVECYVSLASPEHFPWDAKDLQVPVASPYELEVAMGVREWTGDYVTDLDELLQGPMYSVVGQGAGGEVAVQTLGASARVKTFAAGAGARQRRAAAAVALPGAEEPQVRPPPATITPGLHGIPSRYTTEEEWGS